MNIHIGLIRDNVVAQQVSQFLSPSLLKGYPLKSGLVELILCSALDAPATLQVLSSSSTQQAEISIFLLPHALKNVT